MSSAYTEDHLCEKPAIETFGVMRWGFVNAEDEEFGPYGTLERENTGEVVLLCALRACLQNLNPRLPPEALVAAVEELTRDRSAMSLAAANRDIYHLMKEGVKVSVPDREHGGQKEERVRVIDWEKPGENDFVLVRQMTVTGDLYTCRPDLAAAVSSGRPKGPARAIR